MHINIDVCSCTCPEVRCVRVVRAHCWHTVMHWTRWFRDIQPSTYRDGRFDMPADAVFYLQHFQSCNSHVQSAFKSVGGC
jgi:hypothetical protein